MDKKLKFAKYMSEPFYIRSHFLKGNLVKFSPKIENSNKNKIKVIPVYGIHLNAIVPD